MLLGGMTLAVLPAVQANAHHSAKFKKNFKLDPQFEPQSVRYSREYAPGTIVVDPKNHFLLTATSDLPQPEKKDNV